MIKEDVLSLFIDQITHQGFFSIDEALPIEDFKQLRKEILKIRLNSPELFKEARVGNETVLRDSSIRGDKTLWWEMENPTPPQRRFLELIERFKDLCNQAFYLGLREFEGHYAFYEKGTFYKKHLDSFKSENKRTLSVVYFLNESWSEEDGGHLVIDLKDGTQKKILPIGNRLVFFLSKEIPHEVQCTQQLRLSFAGWWKTR